MPFITLASTQNKIFYEIHDIQPSPSAISQSQSKSPLNIIFLHGLGSSHCFYDVIVPYIQADYQKERTVSTGPLRLILVDTEGSGLSSLREEIRDEIRQGRVGSGIGGIRGLARQAKELLEQVIIGDDEKEVVVVGHSMSGMTAVELAADINHSNEGQSTEKKMKVIGAILIGPVVPSQAVTKVFDGRIQVVRKDSMPPLLATIPASATGSLSTPLQRSFIRSLLSAQDPLAYIALCNCISTASVPPYATALSSIPTLIIAGREDKSAPLEGCERILGEIGGMGRMEVLDGVGHWHCIEEGEGVGTLIGRFVGEL